MDSNPLTLPGNQALIARAQAAVASWTSSPKKLVFQTQYDYAESFCQLQGRDSVLASVLHATDLLDVYVVKVEMVREGRCRMSPAQLHRNRARLHRYSYDDYDHGNDWPNYASIDDVATETVAAKSWSDAHNNDVEFKIELDLSTELVHGGNLFADTSSPNEHMYRDWAKAKEPNVEMTFRRCVLVVWPQSRAFVAAGFKPNLARDVAAAAAGDKAGATATLCSMATSATSILSTELVSALELATTVGASDVAISLCRLWAATPQPREHAWKSPKELALVSALAKALHALGAGLLDVVMTDILPKLRKCDAARLATEYPPGAHAIVSALLAGDLYNLTDTLSVLYSLFRYSLLAKMCATSMPWHLSFAKLAMADPTDITCPLVVRLLRRTDADAEQLQEIATIVHTTLQLPGMAPLVVDTVLETCTHVQDALLPSLLSRLEREAVTEHTRRLIQHRLSLLPSLEAGPPDTGTSWCQPYATLPTHPHVQAFLRGPLQTLSHKGCNGIVGAREFATEHFTCDESYHGTTRASATAVASGSGARTRVDITKTDAFRPKVLQEWKRYCDEAATLRATFRI
ncbi:hypothetical protein SDRG_15255 [Saprolegnia diclina VS20]|uniref:Uncharacterized protein n=1 Tax=Saprolegnia diclina (strain VS20) TaxID=1156394 RepID=T0R4E6_SAPDV|nr:hypothetical protein SDRG_15255 [Saprolegnia diclina VS20]EQC26923.1 hypothetical protein SDRG_15255 [Saprolegnia diclina VS20]|eukprot:XP_008619644.1 hypothetical protein SDRG_15255 [Saprolegnia diclina VS20]